MELSFKEHTGHSSSTKGKRNVRPQEHSGSGWPLVQVVSHPKTHEKWLRSFTQVPTNGRYKYLSAADTFPRRLVLLWIRFSTSCRQPAGLSPMYGVKSELPVGAASTEGALCSGVGLESSCAAKTSTWCTTNKTNSVTHQTRTSTRRIWLRCRKNRHLQNIEALAKAVVQRIKLCGQILSHLQGKKEEKELEMWRC